jgi:hypothetical protein
MMDKAQAYNSFWNSFGLKAYDETSVPEGLTMPYLTYEAAQDDFNHPLGLVVSIWDRSSSWTTAQTILSQIEAEIGRGGKIVPYTGGAFWIKRANPWAQRLTGEGGDSIRRIVMNVEVEFID